MDSDLSGLIEIAQLNLLGEAWEQAEVGAVVINDGRRYLDANAAYCALTGYSREELIDLHAGHNLVLEAMNQADFIHRITERHGLGQAVIRHKNGTPLPVSYMLIPSQYTLNSSQVLQLPCYIGLVWPQADALGET